MRKIEIDAKNLSIEFLNKNYPNLFFDKEFDSYFVDPMQRGSKEFFQSVYDAFDGKSGTQNEMLMTETGELFEALGDLDDLSQNGVVVDKAIGYGKFTDGLPHELGENVLCAKLECENHIREEVADVLMLLYQSATLQGLDFARYVSDRKSQVNISRESLKTSAQSLFENVHKYYHQINKQNRGRVDFDQNKKSQLLLESIFYANMVAYFADSLEKIKRYGKYEFVIDENASSVQDWFDFKVQRTSERADRVKKREE